MKVIQLTAKPSIIKSDLDLLAKAPLLPNRYRWEKDGVSLALKKQGERYFLLTSDENFWQQYQNYYQARFEWEEMELSATNGAELLLGATANPGQTAITDEEELDMLEDVTEDVID